MYDVDFSGRLRYPKNKDETKKPRRASSSEKLAVILVRVLYSIVVKMGNTNNKHGSVGTSVSLPEKSSYHYHHGKIRKDNGKRTIRRQSDPNNYADVQLGRLRSVDFRLGNVLIQSGSGGGPGGGPGENGSGKKGISQTDGLLLDRLWSPTTFVFTRTCSKPHKGFGFSCDIFIHKESGAQSEGLFAVRQMSKPKRGFQGMEDSPLDVYDVNPSFQRQVLGLVVKKLATGDKASTILEGVTVFSIQGVLGHIVVKDDWTSLYEVQNGDGDCILVAQRFNRISGGVEFQVFSSVPSKSSTTNTNNAPLDEVETLLLNDPPSSGGGGGMVCLATLLRLEESKFILKVYSSCAPAVKALMISFTVLLMYLISR